MSTKVRNPLSRRNIPQIHRPPNKPPIQTKFSTKMNFFMQNKANFKKVKFYINKAMAREYEKMDTWLDETKQSQTNPNKAKSQKAKMNVTSIITKDYERILNWVIYENKANFNPKQTQTKPILTPAQANIIRCGLRLLYSENLSIIIEKVKLLLRNNSVPEGKGRF